MHGAQCGDSLPARNRWLRQGGALPREKGRTGKFLREGGTQGRLGGAQGRPSRPLQVLRVPRRGRVASGPRIRSSLRRTLLHHHPLSLLARQEHSRGARPPHSTHVAHWSRLLPAGPAHHPRTAPWAVRRCSREKHASWEGGSGEGREAGRLDGRQSGERNFAVRLPGGRGRQTSRGKQAATREVGAHGLPRQRCGVQG